MSEKMTQNQVANKNIEFLDSIADIDNTKAYQLFVTYICKIKAIQDLDQFQAQLGNYQERIKIYSHAKNLIKSRRQIMTQKSQKDALELLSWIQSQSAFDIRPLFNRLISFCFGNSAQTQASNKKNKPLPQNCEKRSKQCLTQKMEKRQNEKSLKSEYLPMEWYNQQDQQEQKFLSYGEKDTKKKSMKSKIL